MLVVIGKNLRKGEEMPVKNITLDYPLNTQPRYGYGKAPHEKLYRIINRNRLNYVEYMSNFVKYSDLFSGIDADLPENDPRPRWVNDWISGFDLITLCATLAMYNPRQYIEIGSGNTTKFARQTISHYNLRTKIISIDPEPRSEIDLLCDELIRDALENIDLGLFTELEAGDIIFVDNSHRVFMNSDVTVVFLDILPCLKPGVLLHFHDIFLPFDYPPTWTERYYSEQYMLAVYLLSGSRNFEILMANHFINLDEELSSVLNLLWEQIPYVTRHGASFWIRTN